METGSGYGVATGWFLRLLGAVYLIAFASLWVQIEGLVGSEGILPVADYLELIGERMGAERYWKLPTLLWFGNGDTALHLLCGGGVLLSLVLIAGIAPIVVLPTVWALYLSLVLGGQTFLGFQWDALLLETGLCALFVAPRCRRMPWRGRHPPPSRAGLWLLWFLLFKLMFLSGAVKLLCMDETWWNLTALDFHYWTQPLPTWTAWYAHQLPAWFQKLSVLLTYAIEIALPFLIFTGRIGRRVVAAGTLFLMLMISWTGNFGFFNLLTMVLCVPLLDDATRGRRTTERTTAGSRFVRISIAACASLLIAISSLTLVRELVRTVPASHDGIARTMAVKADRWLLSWAEPTVLHWTGPFRSINGYGLFRSMTTERPEIVLEGSADGAVWAVYGFKWKPGELDRRPGFVAPHMPRLDWQMWFAALNPPGAQHWLSGLMRGVLRGSPDVLALLEHNPFPDEPPRYVRLMDYRYRFATPDESREQGVWWSRELRGPLTPPLGIDVVRLDLEALVFQFAQAIRPASGQDHLSGFKAPAGEAPRYRATDVSGAQDRESSFLFHR